MIDKLNDEELKVYKLIQSKKTEKQMAEILNIKLYQVKMLIHSVCRKLNVCGKRDIVKRKFDTLRPDRKNRTDRIISNKINGDRKFKNIEYVKNKTYAKRYRFLREKGFSAAKATSCSSELKFQTLCKKYNIEIKAINV